MRLNAIPEFFQRWAAKINYLADVIRWVSDSFSRFPVYKEPEQDKPDGSPK